MVKTRCVLGAAMALFAASLTAPARGFPSSSDPVPAGWTGPVFKLSQAYPRTLPEEEVLPWDTIDPAAEPAKYVEALYRYALAGNVEAGWVVQRNKVRKWYHAPWMHYGASGREFIHGMTRERSTPAAASPGKGELGPDQVHCAQNWAVGFFNPRGGYQTGRVWADPKRPDATLAQFPEGTVIAKLLFTAAPVREVPYLKNAFKWQGNIHVLPEGTCPGSASRRKPQTVRLLQMDLAVKDKRATETGWVFATMAYDGDAAGASPWDRMVPVGIMWGNVVATQQWINPTIGTPQHLGFEGRLNGPVDNPRSSCLSCHATAQTPAVSPMIPPTGDTARWFMNHPGSQPFDPGSTPTDYALQLAMGIQNLRRASTAPPAGSGGSTAAQRRAMAHAFDSGRDVPAQVRLRGQLEYPVGR